MEYCLCIKTNDKNLLHIIRRRDMHLAVYASLRVVAEAKDETEAFAMVAALVQEYCDIHGKLDFLGFRAWLERIGT